MQLSRIFRAVRKRMERSVFACRYICINILYRLGGVPSNDKNRAIAVIEERIRPYEDIEEWAVANRLKYVRRAKDDDFREFRIRWLKALEEEFKQKGD